MFRRRPVPIAEHEARGETARIYHEIRQTLRMSGVNLNFRTWASFEVFFPVMWAAMQPIAASQVFEAEADRVRARAVELIEALPRLEVRTPLGESQRYQLRAALELYHYINPKLVIVTIMVARALRVEQGPSSSGARDLTATTPFGAPARMAAMEMVDEQPPDKRVRRLFRDIKRTLRLSSVNSDYRTLALWPDYLEAAWMQLKPVVTSRPYGEASIALAREAGCSAEAFPVPTGLDVRSLRRRGENTRALAQVTDQFVHILPPLILNITLLARDWLPVEDLRRSPFPM